MLDDLGDDETGGMARSMVWVLGALDHLTDCGLLARDGPTGLSAKGVAAYDQLHASGFRPGPLTVEACLSALKLTPAALGERQFQTMRDLLLAHAAGRLADAPVEG